MLQEFEFDMQHRPGVQHVVANYLSRLESGESGESGDGIRNEFLDAQLFKITVEAIVDESVGVEDRWMMDMHQFLSTGLPPEDLSWDERKRLAIRSRHCFLYRTCSTTWEQTKYRDERSRVTKRR